MCIGRLFPRLKAHTHVALNTNVEFGAFCTFITQK